MSEENKDVLEQDEQEEEEESSEDLDQESDDSAEEDFKAKYEAEKAARLKAESAIEKAKKKVKQSNINKKTENDDDEDVGTRIATLEQSERKRQFGYEHNLSPLEVDKIFQIDPDPSEETLKDPFVKAGLKALQKERRISDNTPSSSNAPSPLRSKDFESMTAKEKQAAYAKYMESKAVSRKK